MSWSSARSRPFFADFRSARALQYRRSMKTHFALASVAALTLVASAAHADESEYVKPGTRARHTAGVALTITGVSFLGTGLVAGVGGVALAFTAAGDTGMGGLVVLAFGG